MRRFFLLGVFFLGPAFHTGFGQTCTNGATTSISGVIYAPNGVDPLPNVLVYIPTTAVGPLPTGVGCPTPGETPSGNPELGATTATDGTFTISDVPVGTNIPLVIKLGKWRRQVAGPSTTACATTQFSTRLPRNQSEGDIPRIAIVTSSTDQMECVLRATGVDDAEFTAPGGHGRINLFVGDTLPGAVPAASAPTESSLMNDPAVLNAYDVLMLPSQGDIYVKPAVDANEQSNLASFLNQGGRAYMSHYEWPYLDQGDPVDLSDSRGFGMWWPDQSPPPPGPAPYVATPGASIHTTFPEAVQFADWLQDTHVTNTYGLIPINRQTQNDMLYWAVFMWFSNSAEVYPSGLLGDALQIVAHTPTYQGTLPTACGRLTFDDYEIRPTTKMGVVPSPVFPSECSAGFSSPEEKAFEYALFELTPDASALLAPITATFGTEPVGVSSAPQAFTWTNNSSFTVTATPSTTSPDFQVLSSTCGVVPGNGTCQVNIVFVPVGLRLRTGYVVVTSTGLLGTEQALVQGTGTQDLTFNTNYLQFGTVPLGDTATLPLIATNVAPFAVPVTPLVVTGDFAASVGTCGTSVPARGSCTLQVTFAPTADGYRTGTMTPPTTENVNLEGIGGDYTLTLSPDHGTIEAGKLDTFKAILTPIGQFIGTVSIACTTTAPITTCTLPNNISLNGTQKLTVDVQTTSKYSVPGYGYSELRRDGRNGLLAVLAACVPLLWANRRRRRALRITLPLILAMVLGSLMGCSGKYPTLNGAYTPAGTYTVTLTATSGGLVRSATYTMNVTQ